MLGDERLSFREYRELRDKMARIIKQNQTQRSQGEETGKWFHG